MKYLNDLIGKNESYKDEGCKYLFNWLHVDVLKRKTTIENTLILYRELYKRFNEEGLNILSNYTNKINENTSDKLVKLIHIYDTFDQFEKEFQTTRNTEKCSNDCISLFTSYLHECRTGYDDDFCNELKNFRAKHNFFIKNYLSCDGEKYLLPDVENSDIVGMVTIPFILILVTIFILPLLYKVNNNNIKKY